MKKKIITILLTVILFLSVTVLGVSTVFRVDAVSVTVTVASEKGKAEAASLQEKLLKLYKKESIFSVEQNKAEKALAEYPYFKMTKFKRAYPNKILVSILEETEVYAIKRGESEYYILGSEGTILDIRPSLLNDIDGAENLQIQGLQVQGEKGGSLTGDALWEPTLTLCKEMDKALGGVRRNVQLVTLTEVEGKTYIVVTMREGVKIVVENPAKLAGEKAKASMEEYFSLSQTQRSVGQITVRDSGNSVFALYENK